VQPVAGRGGAFLHSAHSGAASHGIQRSYRRGHCSYTQMPLSACTATRASTCFFCSCSSHDAAFGCCCRSDVTSSAATPATPAVTLQPMNEMLQHFMATSDDDLLFAWDAPNIKQSTVNSFVTTLQAPLAAKIGASTQDTQKHVDAWATWFPPHVIWNGALC
jgi:hypothetical protein